MSVWLKKQNLIIPFIPWILTILISFSFFVGLSPIIAQEKPTAPIMLEGRTLFYVSESGQYTAQQRAEEANNHIQKI